eukprot:XP_002521667.2 uncharacterized protein LOC8268722 [Ricinus communis]
MENQSPKRMKSHLCIPRLRGSHNTTCTIKNNHRLSPMTLLERFREAVFRLMMLSALSKATHSTSRSRSRSSNSGGPPLKRSYYYSSSADPHHSEAVADCIEFIKKTSVAVEEEEENSRNSAAATEMVIPVPVM